MGRQVNFICSKEDIATIVEFIHIHDASFYEVCRDQREYLRVDSPLNQKSQISWIFFNQYYQQMMKNNIQLDHWYAEAIQFAKKEDINEIFYCRIWAEFGFWTKINGADSYVYKSKDFEKFYSSLARFIKKKALVEKSKLFWFMHDAYQICKQRNLILPIPTSPKLQLELPKE